MPHAPQQWQPQQPPPLQPAAQRDFDGYDSTKNGRFGARNDRFGVRNGHSGALGTKTNGYENDGQRRAKVGVSTEEFVKNGVNLVAFDMSGQGRYRNLWEHYYSEVQGVVFVELFQR